MAEKPIALDAYEALAESYAAAVETKPHNAFYERPVNKSAFGNGISARENRRTFADRRIQSRRSEAL